MLVAELFGEARHHAKWRELSSDEEAAAVAALRELAGGRADLLAEVCGIFEGASEGRHDEPLARQAARLCRLAGADETLIPAWIEEDSAGPQPPAIRRTAEGTCNSPVTNWPGNHLLGWGVYHDSGAAAHACHVIQEG